MSQALWDLIQRGLDSVDNQKKTVAAKKEESESEAKEMIDRLDGIKDSQDLTFRMYDEIEKRFDRIDGQIGKTKEQLNFLLSEVGSISKNLDAVFRMMAVIYNISADKPFVKSKVESGVYDKLPERFSR